jgi:heme exporter protein D
MKAVLRHFFLELAMSLAPLVAISLHEEYERRAKQTRKAQRKARKAKKG